MYIDFDPKKLGGEINKETLKDLSAQGIPPAGHVTTMVGSTDPNWREDGGGGTVSDPGVLMYAEAGRDDVSPL